MSWLHLVEPQPGYLNIGSSSQQQTHTTGRRGTKTVHKGDRQHKGWELLTLRAEDEISHYLTER